MPPADDWQTWFDRHGAALVLLARQCVGCRAEAEDVVQEAFVRFWRSRERVNDPAAFVFACVRRCALDWQRSQRRLAHREEQVARPEAEPQFAQADDNERKAAIETALRELPREQSEVLVMKIWGGLTFTQISAALEIPTNTATSRYRYAVAKLREALAQEPTYE
jgi:RNA polymerase sigma-70 factor (ECF subfamily)